ncbi:oligosaccharide flippase family protein [Vibrio sp. 10N.261.55.A7]|uniref:lipopolysaccharide biosynthesis protein n=1 Tax=Vibrio sp. 10N.261.55.A7 TaxID=1880851 RepID=UPI000C84F02D|nr:oligosaccharide flippase family protein [Vibrio sp. 10N.261.55.A7]PMJ89859.1 hypothetical protein BCU12_01390 [Vibrio sp. 10N.261.55.A7]
MKLIQLPKSISNMLIYAVSLFLAKGISLIMLPFIARYLSPDQLGQLELLATTTVFLSLLVGFAMHENLYRFVGEIIERNLQFKKVCELYTYAVVISAAVGVTVSVGLFFVPSSEGILSTQNISLIALVLAFESALGISTAWLRFQDKAKTFFVISILSSVLQVSGVIFVLLYTPSVTNIFAVGVVTSLIQLVILHGVNRFNWVWAGLNHLLAMLRYSTPLMLSTLVAFGLSGAEKWIIGLSVSIETLGYYAVAAKFSLAMCILVQPFGMWWMPKRFNALSKKGASYTVQVTQVGILYITILALAVGSFSQLFISAALPSAYLNAATLVSGVIVMALFKELAELVNIGILNQKKTHWVLNINIICTLLGLTLSWVLTSTLVFGELGIWGVIIAISIAQVSRAALLLFYSQKLNPLPYQYHALLLIIANTLGCLAINLTIGTSLWLIATATMGVAFNVLVAYRFNMFSAFKLPNVANLILKRA